MRTEALLTPFSNETLKLPHNLLTCKDTGSASLDI